MNLTIQSLIAEVMPNAIASGLMVSTCSIQAPSGSFDAGGAPVGGYVPVAGLQGIQCMSAQPGARVLAGEAKAATQVLSTQFRHVLLAGWYPAIPSSNAGWQAVVDGVTWDILGAESDSQSQMTRMELRIAQI